MSTDDPDQSQPSNPDFEELQRILREMLSGGDAAAESGFDPSKFAQAAGLPIDPAALQGLFSTLQGAMQQPGDGIDWSVTRRTAIDVAGQDEQRADASAATRAFPVAGLWLDEVTDVGASPDAPRTLTRIDWVQQSVDTWIGLAEPVANSITEALMGALATQMPEELSDALAGAGPMMRSVGGALFAMQLGTIIGKLSGEVVSAGDVGIPLITGPGREGGALLPGGVESFAEGLDQDREAVTLYLAVREMAHARLFRHTRWLRLHLISAITDYARGIRIDTDRIEEMAREIDPQHPEEIQELLSSGSLIPPKSPAQEAAHTRLETMLALIEGWVDVVTADAASRLPDAEAIAEMVRRRRATGGPAELAFSTLIGLELRPRRLREAAALWRLVAERGSTSMRDGLWSHPDLLPTTEELDNPTLLLRRLGLAPPAEEQESEDTDFERELARLLEGDLPPHGGDAGEKPGDEGEVDDGGSDAGGVGPDEQDPEQPGPDEPGPGDR